MSLPSEAVVTAPRVRGGHSPSARRTRGSASAGATTSASSATPASDGTPTTSMPAARAAATPVCESSSADAPRPASTPSRARGLEVDVGRGLGRRHLVGGDDRVEGVLEPREPERALDELARRVRRQRDRAGRRRAARRRARTAPGIGGAPCRTSSITRSCSSSISAWPAPGRPSIASSLPAATAREEPSRSRLCSIVNVAAVALEERHLGARPRLLGVEQQAVVVEDHRVRHGRVSAGRAT